MSECVVVRADRLRALPMDCEDCPVSMSRCRLGDISAQECEGRLIAYLTEGCPTPEQVAMLEEAAELLELWERTRQSARHKPPIDDHGQTADWLIRYREAGEEDG